MVRQDWIKARRRPRYIIQIPKKEFNSNSRSNDKYKALNHLIQQRMKAANSIMALKLTIALASLLSAAESQRYEFPTTCTCSFKSRKASDCRPPDIYPTHETLGFNGDCIPTVPENQRLCYKMNVKSCSDEVNHPFHKCRLFDGIPGYKVDQLSMSSDSDSVDITSINGSESKTICFYNVSLSQSSNCSGLRLHHRANHPQEKYIDRRNNDTSSTTDEDICQDYLQVYYRTQHGQQHSSKLCGEELATLDMSLHNTTSFMAVFWSDNNAELQTDSSFNIRAQCM